MTDSNKRKVLLVGATGMLGSNILDALLERGLSVRALLRPGKAEVEERLRSRGVEVTRGDALDPSSLPAAMEGIDVVVTALHNDPNIFVDAHRNLIRAAEEVGVQRLMPSDFSVDFFRLQSHENFNLAMRKEVVPLFDGLSLRPIHILIGAFMDTMLDPRAPFVDWDKATLPYFGDGKESCDFTSVRDAARYVAAACADPDPPPILRFAGDVLTMPQLAVAIGSGRGRALEALNQGSIDDLARLIEETKKTASNPFEWIALQYHHNMVSGRGKLEPLDNTRYPEVKPESVEQFAARTQNEEVKGMSRSGA